MPVQQTSSVDSHRAKMVTLVDQMRIHYQMERVRMSITTQDLVKYCEQNMQSDPLIFPVKDNPFKEKKGCAIL